MDQRDAALEIALPFRAARGLEGDVAQFRRRCPAMLMFALSHKQRGREGGKNSRAPKSARDQHDAPRLSRMQCTIDGGTAGRHSPVSYWSVGPRASSVGVMLLSLRLVRRSLE